MKIPLIDLQAQLGSYRAEALAAFERVMDSQRFILGEEVQSFEEALSRWASVPAVVGVSSGTDALLAALMALELGPGDEVITTPFSFFATAGVVVRLGARPVFVDIDPRTLDLNEEQVRAALSPRTRAIIPVHLFGRVCDLGSLYQDPEAPVIIEDAAQSLGARLRDLRVGQLGRFCCTSFFPAKNLGGFGDGGAVLCRDQEGAEKIQILRVHGSRPKYHHHIVGGNFRLDALQAAILRVKLSHLSGWNQARRENAARYEILFAESGLSARGLLRSPGLREDEEAVFNQYVIRAERRDELQAHLRAQGIGSAIYYPQPLHLQPCFQNLGYAPGDLPNSEAACRDVLALPISPELKVEDQERVTDNIKAFYGL